MHIKQSIYVVSGMQLAFVRLGVAFSIIMVSFRISWNPFRAIGLLRSVIKERRDIHENSGKTKAVKSDGKYYWSINMPGWPSDRFNNFIRNEYLRINSPQHSHLQTIIFAITNLCPLNCIHCYEYENISSSNKLSLEDLKLVMTKIHDNGIRHFQ